MFRTLSAMLLCAIAGEQQAQTICQIQGSGSTSPYVGQQVSTEGLVTALFTGSGSVNGYFLEQPDCDADPSTSNGVFVYDTTPIGVSVGQRLSLTATVTEFNGVTELTNPTIQVIGSGSVVPTDMSLPIASPGQWERYEGMLLRFPAQLTVIDNTGWVQYGELYLAPDRLYTPTEVIDPNDAVPSGNNTSGQGNVGAILARTDLNSRSILLLDDGRTSTYPNPAPWADANGTLRTGSTVTGLTGVLHYAYGEYRLEPAAEVPITPEDRPSVPSVGGDIRAASLNVLNYFITLGDWGAQNANELGRQRTKLVAAIQAMNADVLALCEVENADAAWMDLLAGVNAAMGEDTYSAMEENGFGNGTRTVIFYKPSTLLPITPLYSINTSIFQRPHLTQGFELIGGGGRFLFSTMHLRSKLCDNASGLNLDLGDGQGCFNDNRRAQAAALVAHWEGLRNSTGIPAQLMMGDYNAYSQEDPLDALRASGLQEFVVEGDHSYVYQGRSGSLDHAFGTSEVSTAVTGLAVWHINSDEPAALDYSDANSSRYQPNAYRCSDHDPVLVGLQAAQLAVSVPIQEPSDLARFTLHGKVGQWWFDTPGMAHQEISLIDAKGRVVRSPIRVIAKGVTEVDLGNLASGLYLWRIAGERRTISGRFLLP